MKIYACVAAFSSASLFVSLAVASPIAQPVKPALHDKARWKGAAKVADTKYFHEPGGDNILGHYDARYFKEIVSYEERTDTQLHMIRAYLNFFRDQRLDTWIAHGTLLGWWWNGKRLPWDWDMDTQVSAATLRYLGDNHNQSIHTYVSEDGQVERKYLLDINPWIVERERGDGMNIIDARWIDMRNGLFIDITGLAETHPDSAPGVWVCKNYHRYHTSELYPMRETVFEGVVAKVPYAYDKILIDEYQEKALIVTEFEGHAWDPDRKEWIKSQVTIEQEKVDAEKKEQQKQEIEIQRKKAQKQSIKAELQKLQASNKDRERDEAKEEQAADQQSG